MAETFQAAIDLTRHRAVAIIDAVENVEDRTPGLGQAEILHRHQLGHREAVVHLHHRDLIARVGDAGFLVRLARRDAGGVEIRAVPRIVLALQTVRHRKLERLDGDQVLLAERSGDLGRINDSGELVYIARLKEIIRVGGENLAPAEVEQVLRDECRVQQVCVLGVPDARLDEVAAAVVVGAADADWMAVTGAMRKRLAGFKMPKAIYVASELPITATNRVQRAVLRQWIAEGRLKRVI